MARRWWAQFVWDGDARWAHPQAQVRRLMLPQRRRSFVVVREEVKEGARANSTTAATTTHHCNMAIFRFGAEFSPSVLDSPWPNPAGGFCNSRDLRLSADPLLASPRNLLLVGTRTGRVESLYG